MPDKIAILGVPVHDRTRDELMHVLSAWLLSNDLILRQVATVNPEFIMTARRDPEFARVLQSVDLATADGIGILLAARILGCRLSGRLTGVDLTELLADMREPRPSLFFLGAAPGVAAEAGERLQVRFPGVEIAGIFSGSPSDNDVPEILGLIRESGANTLLVAFGAPEQDKWIAKHRQALAGCGIVVAIGVGGTFDFLSGRVPRAPRLIRRIGLEWLYRLIRQPWRWRRQLALPQFAALVLWERFTGKGKASDRNHGSTER
jgi:N-acetylglucosaminyldiphosphoundecaprenol N-acetyl-beta-D-mannosaminyltransferase